MSILLVHDSDGTPIGIGTLPRVVPNYLRRAVLARDESCGWPGCTNTHWLDMHHVIHVAHRGRTDEDNLMPLCGAHHRLIHEGGFKMRGRPGRDLKIIRPDGSVLGPGRRRICLRE